MMSGSTPPSHSWSWTLVKLLLNVRACWCCKCVVALYGLVEVPEPRPGSNWVPQPSGAATACCLVPGSGSLHLVAANLNILCNTTKTGQMWARCHETLITEQDEIFRTCQVPITSPHRAVTHKSRQHTGRKIFEFKWPIKKWMLT